MVAACLWATAHLPQRPTASPCSPSSSPARLSRPPCSPGQAQEEGEEGVFLTPAGWEGLWGWGLSTGLWEQCQRRAVLSRTPAHRLSPAGPILSTVHSESHHLPGSPQITRGHFLLKLHAGNVSDQTEEVWMNPISPPLRSFPANWSI